MFCVFCGLKKSAQQLLPVPASPVPLMCVADVGDGHLDGAETDGAWQLLAGEALDGEAVAVVEQQMVMVWTAGLLEGTPGGLWTGDGLTGAGGGIEDVDGGVHAAEPREEFVGRGPDDFAVAVEVDDGVADADAGMLGGAEEEVTEDRRAGWQGQRVGDVVDGAVLACLPGVRLVE